MESWFGLYFEAKLRDVEIRRFVRDVRVSRRCRDKVSLADRFALVVCWIMARGGVRKHPANQHLRGRTPTLGHDYDDGARELEERRLNRD